MTTILGAQRRIEDVRAELRANLTDLRAAGVDLAMVFGTSSKIFTAAVRDMANNTASHNPALAADVIKIALYGNTGTPDQTVADTLTGYNQATSQWVTANEVTATGWPAAGLTLASVTSTFTSVTYTFTAANKAGGATDTVTAAYGCLIYDNSITTFLDGICYLAFGGSQTVTGGTFTVAFGGSGIFTIGV